MGKRKGSGRRKRMKSGAKWMALLLAVLLAGGIVEAVRLANMGGNVAVTAPFRPQYSANDNAQASIDLAASLCGIDAFCARYGTTGAGQKIALIDSGMDLSHEAFAHNVDGTRKAAVYYDYTDEGVLYTEVAEQEGAYVSLGGTRYHIGGIYNHADRFYIGFLDAESLRPQQAESAGTQMAVLVTATGSSYDCIYPDTNRNCDFADEAPLYSYQAGGGHVTLRYGAYPVDAVVSDIAADGRRVQFSADTLGHGTFLAGVLAANGEVYRGLAPQAQLYVYKIFDRHGASSQEKLARAIEQAVQDGVDCINLSLSIAKHEAVLPALRKALQSAEKAGIPIVAAVGNYGPGADTAAYPARDRSVIAVGSCAYPEQYLLDRAILLEAPIIPDYSGRGLSGMAAPFLVAPSGVISTLPGWYREPYLYDYGTSISAAIATAAVSHLQEAAAKDARLAHCPLSTAQIKALLAHWAQDLGEPARAQGYGALYMGQLDWLQDVPVLPALREAQPTVYRLPANDEANGQLFWQFDVAQGQSQSWQVLLPADTRILEVSMLVDTEPPESALDRPTSMGRCRMYVYSPDGTLVKATDYIGASYGRDMRSSTAVSVRHPEEGAWEIVVTSADNLSLYHHFTSTGMLYLRTE